MRPMIAYPFPLESGRLMAQIVVPGALRKHEAERICQFVMALVMPVTSSDAPGADESEGSEMKAVSSDRALAESPGAADLHARLQLACSQAFYKRGWMWHSIDHEGHEAVALLAAYEVGRQDERDSI